MKTYVCTIDAVDSKELITYENKRGALEDLAKTIGNTALPDELLRGLSAKKLTDEAAQWGTKKADKFKYILEKYQLEDKYCPEQLYVYEDGKVYYLENQSCEQSCNCNHS